VKKVKEYAFSTVLEASYEEAVSKVIGVLKEEGFGVLTEIDPAIQGLIMNLSSSDEILRIHSRESLVKMGKPAVPQLVEGLMRGGHWLRWEAAKTLGEIGDPTAAPALVEALKDEEFDVQCPVISSYGTDQNENRRCRTPAPCLNDRNRSSSYSGRKVTSLE
jgi:hypothetical protein